jgi:hypothetical protein
MTRLRAREAAAQETSATQPVALGIKTHTGWAAVVAVAGPIASANVVAKRRIDMATTFDEGAVYHKGQELPLAQAEALVRSSEEKFQRIARDALEELLAELRTDGRAPVAAALVSGKDKALPPLASILKSHALVHAAEGDLYRRVLLRASEACGIPTLLVPENQIEEQAVDALQTEPAELAQRLAAMGKASGKPWTKDQKQSALVAWIALAAR